MRDLAWLTNTIMLALDGDGFGLIPTFIELAEHRLQRELRLRCMERRGSWLTAAGEESVWLPEKRVPGDWDVFLEMRSVSMDGEGLRYVTPTNFDQERRRGGPGGQNARNGAYTIVGRELLFAPTPGEGREILLTYYGEIPPLSEEQPFNDLLVAHPDLYLYACLVESVPFLRSSVPAQDWTVMYQKAVTDAQFMDRRNRFSKNITAMSPRKGSV